MKISLLSFIWTSFLFVQFASAQNTSLPIECKKQSKKSFETKSAEIIKKIAATNALSLEAFKYQPVDSKKGSTGKPKLTFQCESQVPITDDGGERCTFKCSAAGHQNAVLVLYENFENTIQLLKIEIERGT